MAGRVSRIAASVLPGAARVGGGAGVVRVRSVASCWAPAVTQALATPQMAVHVRWQTTRQEQAQADQAEQQGQQAQQAPQGQQAQAGQTAEGGASASPPPPTPEQVIAQLQERVKELEDTRLRLLAEMENVRMIARRDVANAATFATRKIAKSLLDVSDNLERAVASVPEAQLGKDQTLDLLFQGVQMTSTELQKVFVANGVIQFGTVGEKYDPMRHEAMMQIPGGAGVPAPGTVAHVMKKGYMLKDWVLRAAQVAYVIQPAAGAAAGTAAPTDPGA